MVQGAIFTHLHASKHSSLFHALSIQSPNSSAMTITCPHGHKSHGLGPSTRPCAVGNFPLMPIWVNARLVTSPHQSVFTWVICRKTLS